MRENGKLKAYLQSRVIGKRDLENTTLNYISVLIITLKAKRHFFELVILSTSTTKDGAKYRNAQFLRQTGKTSATKATIDPLYRLFTNCFHISVAFLSI